MSYRRRADIEQLMAATNEMCLGISAVAGIAMSCPVKARNRARITLLRFRLRRTFDAMKLASAKIRVVIARCSACRCGIVPGEIDLSARKSPCRGPWTTTWVFASCLVGPVRNPTEDSGHVGIIETSSPWSGSHVNKGQQGRELSAARNSFNFIVALGSSPKGVL